MQRLPGPGVGKRAERPVALSRVQASTQSAAAQACPARGCSWSPGLGAVSRKEGIESFGFTSCFSHLWVHRLWLFPPAAQQLVCLHLAPWVSRASPCGCCCCRFQPWSRGEVSPFSLLSPQVPPECREGSPGHEHLPFGVMGLTSPSWGSPGRCVWALRVICSHAAVRHHCRLLRALLRARFLLTRLFVQSSFTSRLWIFNKVVGSANAGVCWASALCPTPGLLARPFPSCASGFCRK